MEESNRDRYAGRTLTEEPKPPRRLDLCEALRNFADRQPLEGWMRVVTFAFGSAQERGRGKMPSLDPSGPRVNLPPAYFLIAG